MLCDVCRERDATVTLTHAVKGEVNVLHLCQRCAAERGIETSVTTPLKNMIADYLPAVLQEEDEWPESEDVPLKVADLQGV